MLAPELSGILKFALEGLHRLKAAKCKIVNPETVVAKRKARLAEQDTFGLFAEEVIVKAAPHEVGQ